MTQPNTLLGKQAVLDGWPDHPAVKAIESWNPEALIDAKYDRGELTLTVPPQLIRSACKTMQEAGYNFFDDMTAVDWHPATPRFQLSYHLLSHQYRHYLRLRVLVGEPDPSVPSLTPVWPAANFYEREIFDLFGIRFEEHPDLRRIMMPDDWQGHPLRKDYPVEGYR
ncbi:MAG: NADH-quinone oxidoreductase subunit C [Acidobacteriota bacterium]